MCPDRFPPPAGPPPAFPERHVARIGDRGIVYADYGGDGVPMLALHGSFGRGSVFGGLAGRLAGRVRVIAPDQRGHGESARAEDYGREAFVGDAAALLRHLGFGRPVPVLGHSLGGITAYQLAARFPELVSCLVVEDAGPVMRSPEVGRPVLDVRGLPRTAATYEALGAAIEAQGVPDSGYFLQSAVESAEGCWRLLFDWDDMTAVQEGGVGDWWADWLGSHCPALVLRGSESGLLPGGLAREMTERRPGTRLVEFPGAGHWIHDDDPEGVARAVAEFLEAG